MSRYVFLRDCLWLQTAGEGAASVLLCPEGVLSSGTSAVLRYQKFVFGLGLLIQPLAIRRSKFTSNPVMLPKTPH
jgi:hypothetical protein